MRSITTAFLLFLTVLASACHSHPNPVPFPNPIGDKEKKDSFPFDGRQVFYVGPQTGPPILLLHELPGLTPQCYYLARRLAKSGYRVYMPLMFGSPGEDAAKWNAFKLLFRRDFHPIADETAPIVKSLRALRDHIHALHPKQKMGVIGMCITGNLPPAFLDRDYVKAAVMSQPALPTIGGDKENRIALSQSDIDVAKESHVPILAFRFVTDTLSPEARRQKLMKVFKEQDQITFRALCIETPAHAVLTTELFDAPDHPKETGPSAEALKELIEYLNRQLVAP
jgi:dienelactone hydrolase